MQGSYVIEPSGSERQLTRLNSRAQNSVEQNFKVLQAGIYKKNLMIENSNAVSSQQRKKELKDQPPSLIVDDSYALMNDEPSPDMNYERVIVNYDSLQLASSMYKHTDNTNPINSTKDPE